MSAVGSDGGDPGSVCGKTLKTVVGFASNETSWFQQTGTFEVVA